MGAGGRWANREPGVVLYAHNPAPGKQQDSHKFEASLDYSTRVCLKKQIKMKTLLARVLTNSLRKMR